MDAQSFPLDTPSSPNMKQGAYTPEDVYSMADITSIVNYATDRGVRVVFEIDTPGHAASWGKGYPEIMSKCKEKYFYNVNNWALNPTLDETYTVLFGILKDVVAATGTSYLHLGGDEVVYGCWGADASIVQYMADNGIASYADLFAMFIEKADDMAAQLKTTAIHWEDVFIAGIRPPMNTIFDVWTDSSKVRFLMLLFVLMCSLLFPKSQTSFLSLLLRLI